MFTIRIDQNHGGGDRMVYECVRYGVVMRLDDVRLTLQVPASASDLQLASEVMVTVRPGEVAYVMNDRGDTIDKIVAPVGRRRVTR